MTQAYALNLLVVFGSVALWLSWHKLGQIFVELVRIRHELEDVGKRQRTQHLDVKWGLIDSPKGSDGKTDRGRR